MVCTLSCPDHPPFLLPLAAEKADPLAGSSVQLGGRRHFRHYFQAGAAGELGDDLGRVSPSRGGRFSVGGTAGGGSSNPRALLGVDAPPGGLVEGTVLVNSIGLLRNLYTRSAAPQNRKPLINSRPVPVCFSRSTVTLNLPLYVTVLFFGRRAGDVVKTTVAWSALLARCSVPLG